LAALARGYFFVQAATTGTMATPAPQKNSTAPAVAAIVDELGFLEKEVAPWKPKMARVELLRKSLRAHYDAELASTPHQAEGKLWVATLGAKGLSGTVNVVKLSKLISLRALTCVVECTQKALATLPGVKAELVMEYDQTGSRTIELFEKPKK
jgi:hypothetical protein